MGYTLKQSHKPVGRENNHIIARTELAFGGHGCMYICLTEHTTNVWTLC